MPEQAFQPDLLFCSGRVMRGATLNVRDGRVASVGDPAPGVEPRRLHHRAILPGLTVAHSHAFQRAIRGRTEHRSQGRDDFWSWREAMYAAAERLDPDDLLAVSKFFFLQMARAGITAGGGVYFFSPAPHGEANGRP